MNKIITYSYAKINLTLDVLGKRQDGYHNVLTLMQQIGLKDKIILRRTKDERSKIMSNMKNIPLDDSNLAMKAADVFLKAYNINEHVSMELIKSIPPGAGLGGGSSNAAATLKALNKLFNINAGIDELMPLTKTLGADVTFFLNGGTQLASGIGQDLDIWPKCPNINILIVKPPFDISTKTVYESLDLSTVCERPDTRQMLLAINRSDKALIAKNLVNVLEIPAIKQYPEINDIKIMLKNTKPLGVALLSGSGSSVFAMYSSYYSAKKAYEYMNLESEYDLFLSNTR